MNRTIEDYKKAFQITDDAISFVRGKWGWDDFYIGIIGLNRYILEMKTVTMNLGRNTGKTEYIGTFANPKNDIVLTSTSSMKRVFSERFPNLSECIHSQSEFQKLKDKVVQNVWVNDASQFYKGDIEDVILSLKLRKDSIVAMLG